ncbi:hypothetical protein KEG38_32095 [Polyangium jinanense]|uniref:hypothetical protein n=1 Tax=Polyangium jinanense TaxID=2829994 RepID=UPI00233FAE4B|nr:hypothetical protein [Polyangium jinanense]MDC3958541.1 hypothetical protein [Polyangium jinanense]
MSDSLNLVELPYSDRQIIVVSDDVVVKAARRAEEESRAKKQPPNWGIITQGLVAPILLGSVGALIVAAVVKGVEAWGKARARGMRVLQVAKSEASQLVFQPGHPRDGVLYVGHPAKPDLYYSAAEFHRFTFEHKVSEAINLLMHLGATRIRVESVAGWSREFAARLTVPLGPGEAIGGEVGGERSTSSSILYEARLRGTKAPRVPEQLVWYPHEPTWQSVAGGRLDFGLREFSLGVVYEQDYGINAKFKADAHEAGFDLGGRFEEHAATTWRIAGEFAEDGGAQ